MKVVSHTFECLTCDPRVEVEGSDLALGHLRSVHKVDELKGSRKKLGHFDFSSGGWATTWGD
jgi:hypothetical protein